MALPNYDKLAHSDQEKIPAEILLALLPADKKTIISEAWNSYGLQQLEVQQMLLELRRTRKIRLNLMGQYVPTKIEK